jgi:integrase
MAGKRGNNEGSISKRADGRWMARLTLPDGTRKTFYARTRHEAAHMLSEALRDVQQGLPLLEEKQTLEHFLAHWLEARRYNLKPGTWRRYEEVARLHLSPTLGHVLLARLTAQQVEHLLAAKLATDLSPTTVAHIHTLLRTALNHALRLGLVARNVATLVQPPRRAHPEMQVLDPAQVQTLFHAARGDRLEALYILAVSTGMRLGELLGLRWEDIDLNTGRLQIQQVLRFDQQGQWHLSTPKTPKSRRRIELPPTTREALLRHRAHQLEERQALGAAWVDHQLVFTRPDGEPLRGTHVLEREFRPLLEEASLPPIRLHDLRHTAATLLLLQNVPVKVVSAMLGHSSVAITLDRYSHVLPSMQRDAAAAMERLLAPHHNDK